MSVTRAEMELQALWYLDSLERIFGERFRGELAPKVWINVAMVLANMVDGGPQCEVPADLVYGLAERGLVERVADRLYRNTGAGKETLSRAHLGGASAEELGHSSSHP
ncbi:MAG TPA: hypothetical protein VIV57_05935 [Anaeromyxobacter sp.]